MVPQVSPLVQAFLTATGRCVSPPILCECWPPEHSIIPRQPVDEIQAVITQCLDEDAMHENHRILHGTCSRGWILIRTIGRRIAYPTPGFNCRPQLEDTGELAGIG